MVQPKSRRVAFESSVDAAKADAIADATTKYGELPAKVAALEAGDLDLITNGSFRDGLTGWGNVGGWTVESNGVTSWARTTLGSDASLTQSITIPPHLLGKTVRLYALAMTTSVGTLFTRVTTTTGNTDLAHPLTAGAYQLKYIDVAIPANQGSTPIVVNVGRYSGTVYMTAIRLEAL